MQHLVLARKWRPQIFSDIVGQTTAVTILRNIVKSQRLHHAYLLTGTRGVGKTTIARIIAKALNCSNIKDGDPCGQCDSCKQIEIGRFVDVIEIDAASNTGVDNIRELIDNSKYAPSIGKYKIYIIDEVHMLSKSAFNAMLKTLEEPPEHVVFILATTDLQKVPITVLSRCLQLKLSNLSTTEIQNHLAYVLNQEQIAFDNEALQILATSAKGSMRDALSLLDQAIAFCESTIDSKTVRGMLGISDDVQINQLIDTIIELNSQKLVDLSQQINNEGADLSEVLQRLNDKFCQIAVNQLSAYGSDQNITRFAQAIGVNDVQLYFEITNLGIKQIANTNDKYPVFIMTLLRMIAFHIGTSETKQLVVSGSNFNVDRVGDANIPTTQAEGSNPSPVVKAEASPNLVTPNKETPKAPATTSIETPNINRENWFDLIHKLKANLGAFYPFLENAKFIDFKDSILQITIDQRYDVSLNSNATNKIQEIITDHLNHKITLKIEFAKAIDETLRGKINQENQYQQSLADESIAQDPNIAYLLDGFSATIIAGSIKPKV